MDYLAAVYALTVNLADWLPVLAAGVLVGTLALWALLWLNLSQLRSRSRR